MINLIYLNEVDGDKIVSVIIYCDYYSVLSVSVTVILSRVI